MEGNVLFNYALNTFYLWLHGIRDSQRGNPLLPLHGFFQSAARDLLYAPSHRQYITYHSLCSTSHGVLA